MKKLIMVRALLLTGGVFMSWTAVIRAFQNFYTFEGTIFKVRDCVVSNPVVTPCFYGAIAFAIALIWALALWTRTSGKSARNLRWLLIAGTIFAWVNVAYEAVLYYGLFAGPAIGCTPATTPPWQTPCFAGAVIFSLSLWVSWMIAKRSRG